MFEGVKLTVSNLDPKDDRHFDMIVTEEDLESIFTENTAQLIRFYFHA